ncbi:hypothetical protein EIP91_009751 [Steccherinum ochraceum]|uniref:BTB domain-containing protein n=1 Tax=Steccherinum ochraceum TaxID=92696 RepID=A0A4R0RDV1_9APHY|nr:hypothetical protein EIP91_009751 [Steccherinum ochraceum]
MSSSPEKKRKLDMNDVVDGDGQSSSRAPLEKSAVWFEDGNIILVSEGKGFKVYRGPLDAEVVDGCLAVHMPDSSQDLECFLSAICDSTSKLLNPDSTLTFDEVSTLLRLGTKYQVERLCKEAVRRLEQCFPKKLENLVTGGTRTDLVDLDGTKYFSAQSMSMSLRFLDCKKVVDLARFYGLNQLLPAAFLACTHMKEKDLLRWQPHNGTDDLLRCFKGKLALRNEARRKLRAVVLTLFQTMYKYLRLDTSASSTQASGSGANQVQIVRGGVWFEDGSVVLIAQGKGFKVYKGILAHNSEIFRDMFNIPQPEEPETLDGCPVVHMQDDVSDLECFLSALCHNTSRLLDHSAVLTFAEVAALLRMGSKYEVGRIRGEAVRRLNQCFPGKLSDYSTARTRSNLLNNVLESNYFSSTSVSLQFSNCREAIDLARAHGLDDLLPAAFHAFMQAADTGILTWKPFGGIEDALRVLKGRDVLERVARRNLNVIAATVAGEDCEKKVDCSRARNDVWEEKRAETWTKLREYFDLPPAPATSAENGESSANG